MTFIVFEGPDGTGKSTLLAAVSEQLRQKRPDLTVISTREPGGTVLAEKLRRLALSNDMSDSTRALLMYAARRDHIEHVLSNSDENTVILCDRYWISSIAYQCDVDVHSHMFFKHFVGAPTPDLLVHVDAPDEVLDRRLSERDTFDLTEKQDQQRIRTIYRDVISKLRVGAWPFSQHGKLVNSIMTADSCRNPPHVLANQVLVHAGLC